MKRIDVYFGKEGMGKYLAAYRQNKSINEGIDAAVTFVNYQVMNKVKPMNYWESGLDRIVEIDVKRAILYAIRNKKVPKKLTFEIY